MVYKWAAGSQVKGVAIEVAGPHLEKLRRKNGGNLTSKIVVADARDKSSPMHPAVFRLNQKDAAEKWYEETASYILRSIVIVTSEDGEEERTVRAFVSVIEDDEPVYTSIVRAMKDDDLRAQVLREAKQSFEELRDKYRDLQEFAAVYEALEAVEV